MATITVTPGYNWTSGEVVNPTKMNNTAAPTATVSNIVDADISPTAAIAAGKLAGTLDLSSKTVTLPDSNISTSKIANAAVSAAKLDGAQTGAAPIYGCRAWVNFDGTTVTNVGGEDRCNIRASGNISKVVRNATGDYSVVFTTAMSDANYCALTSTTDNNAQRCAVSLNRDGSVASGARVIVVEGMTNTLTNAAHIDLAIFR